MFHSIVWAKQRQKFCPKFGHHSIFGPTPTGGIGPLNPVSSLSTLSLSLSRVRQFFWKTAYWNFLIFCMNTSLWEGKVVTFLFFSGKFEIWPFWPIFGQKWPILAQNGLFWSIFGLFIKIPL